MLVKESNCKAGMRVKIRKDSVYYGINESNPKDVGGAIRNDGHLYVAWDNGTQNTYGSDDLETISEERSINIFN